MIIIKLLIIILLMIILLIVQIVKLFYKIIIFVHYVININVKNVLIWLMIYKIIIVYKIMIIWLKMDIKNAQNVKYIYKNLMVVMICFVYNVILFLIGEQDK